MNRTTSDVQSQTKPLSAHIDDNAVGNIPAELRELDRWVAWRWEFRVDKWTKPPIDPLTGRPTDATNPLAWMSFDKARKLSRESGDGIGIALGTKDNQSGLTGFDYDNCIDGQGNVDARVLDIIRTLGSYTERTPSGRGLRTLIWSKKEGTQCVKTLDKASGFKIEVYDSGRYLTVTGRVFTDPDGTRYDEIYDDREQGQAQVVYQDLFGKPTNGHADGNGRVIKPVEASDEDLIRKARESMHGDRFSALFDRGDTGLHGGDDSSADMSLMNDLAFWTNKDAGRMERLFSISELGKRGKWTERPDYRKRTIDEAIDKCQKGYTPGFRPSSNGHAPSSNGHEAPKVNEAVDDPHRLARMYLESREVGGKRAIVHHRGEFHAWQDAAYRPLPDGEVNAANTRLVKREFDRINPIEVKAWEDRGRKDKRGVACDPPVVRKVGTRIIGDIAQAIRGETMLPGSVDPPTWLIDNPPFPAKDVLPTANALVHLPSFVEEKDGAIIKPTPEFFCPYALDYGFNRDAPLPHEWAKFLFSVWPEDIGSQDTLQEWMGYLLTPDTSHQKIGVFIGPPRSGRGTISRVISKLIGAGNVASPTFSGLASHFGASCLIGKPVAIVGDARQSKKSDWAVALERLLMISGEDAIEIDRKNKDPWTGKLPTRLMLISNELPQFLDQSGALAARFLLFRFTETFLGKEDKGLDAKLEAELPGILLWAIEGWKRLRDRGRFLQPKTGQDLLDQFRDYASPIGVFVREKCDIEPGRRTRRSDLFNAWREWCIEMNREPGTDDAFGRSIRTVCPHLETSQPRDAQGNKYRAYEGIGLKPATPY